MIIVGILPATPTLGDWLIPKLCATDQPRNELGCDRFAIDAVLAHGNMARQMLSVHAAKGTEEIAHACPHAFGRVDVDFTNAIPIVIACPCVNTMVDRDM